MGRGGGWVVLLVVVAACSGEGDRRRDGGTDAGALDGHVTADGWVADAPRDGSGSDGAAGPCPTAEAVARLQGSADAPSGELDVRPLDTVELDGSGSAAAPGSAIASWAWEVAERPEGSTATLQPDGTVSRPTLFVDLVGDYRLTLRVTDDRGVTSCEAAEVVIHAAPSHALYVQLVWATPGDPDPTDVGAGRGADLDLHLLREGGTWNAAPYDCHWANKTPNWGDGTLTEDDPSLDIDDTDGWGPEAISLTAPEGTAADPVGFDVGVFYFSDHGFGPSDATLRVYVDGALALTIGRAGLSNRHLWHAARIDWPARTVTPVDALYPGGFP